MTDDEVLDVYERTADRVFRYASRLVGGEPSPYFVDGKLDVFGRSPACSSSRQLRSVWVRFPSASDGNRTQAHGHPRCEARASSWVVSWAGSLGPNCA
jgi:hypothetical protein